MAVQRRRGLVQGAALNCQGIAVRFYRAAHLGKLFLHSGNAVTLFNAQPPGVADDGGSAAEAPQCDEHRAKVWAIGQVDLHRLQQAAMEGHMAAAALKLCTALL